MVLKFQRVTLIVYHQLTRPDDRGVTHGHSGQTDARKPDYHCRFSERNHPHSIGFSGGQLLSSYVEGSSALDFPLIYDAQSQDPS